MSQSKRILITGAAGFFGAHFCEHIICNTNWEIIALVRMGKVGTLDRLKDPPRIYEAWKSGRLKTVWHDFRSPVTPYVAEQIGAVDYVVHAGGETHVDRSIADPRPFVESNIVGTLNVLQYARDYLKELKWLNYFSTDEVYGPAPEGVFHREDFPYNATNPYSATKAGAEQLVNAFGNTYGLPVFITSTMNLIGERQHHEKFIPKAIRRVLKGQEIQIHADATKTKAGQRHYIHCRNASDALLFLLANASQRERYNIVGEKEYDNLALAQLITDIVGKPLIYKMTDFHSERPGHDLRYALDGTKLREMGWAHPIGFEKSLEKTVTWFLENRKWLGP